MGYGLRVWSEILRFAANDVSHLQACPPGNNTLAGTPKVQGTTWNVCLLAQFAYRDHYVSWVRRNPHISLAAFDAKDRRTVFAYVALLPLPETTILEVLSGERNEMDIQPEEVESYERPGGYTLLVESAVSHPDHPEKLGIVLKGLMDYWCEQYPQRYIDKIYAQSVSDEGDILIQKLYFAARYDIAETAYMLDLKRPGASRLIKRFQECLKTKI